MHLLIISIDNLTTISMNCVGCPKSCLCLNE